ncbi:MAG: hypothetical protein GDA50_07450 [Alphaproteobacteria bacterium GM202ARS2]|nr:hypothetical protein [Alphaproteobacteria bacterium GM202ARS2]
MPPKFEYSRRVLFDAMDADPGRMIAHLRPRIEAERGKGRPVGSDIRFGKSNGLSVDPVTGAWSDFRPPFGKGSGVYSLAKAFGLSERDMADVYPESLEDEIPPERLKELKARAGKTREEQEKRRKLETDRSIRLAQINWEASQEITAGDPAWVYLESRGLTHLAPYLGFLSEVHIWSGYRNQVERVRELCLVVSVTDAAGEIVAIQMTRLDREGRKDRRFPRRSQGAVAQGFVRLTPGNRGDLTGLVVMGEGLETAGSILHPDGLPTEALDDLTVLIALGGLNHRRFERPDPHLAAARHLALILDRDVLKYPPVDPGKPKPKPHRLRTLLTAARASVPKAMISIIRASPSTAGDKADLNDTLKAEGAAGIVECLERARVVIDPRRKFRIARAPGERKRRPGQPRAGMGSDEVPAYLDGPPVDFDDDGLDVPLDSTGRVISKRWHRNCLKVKTTGALKKLVYNVIEALNEHPELADKVRYNAFAETIEARDLPWRPSETSAWESWTETDNTDLAAFLQWEGLEVGTPMCLEGVAAVAGKRRIDPLADRLNALEWDGERRLDGWIRSCMMATADGLSIEDEQRYLSLVGRWTLISGVARGLDPGCKADCLPVLIGPQGTGKSTVCRVLCLDPSWFSDSLNTMEGKDSYGHLQAKQILELAELSAVRRTSDVERVKHFLSKSVDSYRPPYGRINRPHPRHCIFIGTTNDRAFLLDDENRRFWPIDVSFVDTAKIASWRDQLWAEAVQAYRDDALWYPSGAEEEALCGKVQGEHRVEDPWQVAAIRIAEDEARKSERRGGRLAGWVACADIINRMLDLKSQTSANGKRVGMLMKLAGWEDRRVKVCGVRQTFYRRPIAKDEPDQGFAANGGSPRQNCPQNTGGNEDSTNQELGCHDDRGHIVAPEGTDSKEENKRGRDVTPFSETFSNNESDPDSPINRGARAKYLPKSDMQSERKEDEGEASRPISKIFSEKGSDRGTSQKSQKKQLGEVPRCDHDHRGTPTHDGRLGDNDHNVRAKSEFQPPNTGKSSDEFNSKKTGNNGCEGDPEGVPPVANAEVGQGRDRVPAAPAGDDCPADDVDGEAHGREPIEEDDLDDDDDGDGSGAMVEFITGAYQEHLESYLAAERPRLEAMRLAFSRAIAGVPLDEDRRAGLVARVGKADSPLPGLVSEVVEEILRRQKKAV